MKWNKCNLHEKSPSLFSAKLLCIRSSNDNWMGQSNVRYMHYASPFLPGAHSALLHRHCNCLLDFVKSIIWYICVLYNTIFQWSDEMWRNGYDWRTHACWHFRNSKSTVLGTAEGWFPSTQPYWITSYYALNGDQKRVFFPKNKCEIRPFDVVVKLMYRRCFEVFTNVELQFHGVK